MSLDGEAAAAAEAAVVNEGEGGSFAIPVPLLCPSNTGSPSSSVPAGTYWQDHTAAASAPSLVPAARLKNRPTTVVYVVNQAAQLQLAESLALQCLREACESVSAALQTVPFEKLDFGETSVLDYFYNAVFF